MIARRSIITGLVALVAAPAIVRVSSLMPVNAALQPGNLFFDNEQIMQGLEALDFYKVNARCMIEATKDGELTARHVSDYEFYKGEQHSVDVLYGSTDPNLSSDDVKSLMEDQIRIRVPNTERYRMFQYVKERRTLEFIPPPSVPVALSPLALAAAAVAIAPVLLEKSVTRRFWSK